MRRKLAVAAASATAADCTDSRFVFFLVFCRFVTHTFQKDVLSPLNPVQDRAVSMPVVPVSVAAAAVSAPEIQCSVCKTWNEAGCKFCADCGETLVSAATNQSSSSIPTAASSSVLPAAGAGGANAVVSSAPPSEQSATAIKCPKCRRPNACDQKFCRKCGWELAKARKLNSKSPAPSEPEVNA